MEKFKLFKENLHHIELKILKSKGFNIECANFIISYVHEINKELIDINKSEIKIKDDEEHGYFYISLISNSENLEMNITLFRRDIEMFVAGEGHPVFDSLTLSSRNIEKVTNKLNKWFTKDISRQTDYVGTEVKRDIFRYKSNDSDKLKTLHKSTILNYWKEKVDKKIYREYPSWVM